MLLDYELDTLDHRLVTTLTLIVKYAHAKYRSARGDTEAYPSVGIGEVVPDNACHSRAVTVPIAGISVVKPAEVFALIAHDPRLAFGISRGLTCAVDEVSLTEELAGDHLPKRGPHSRIEVDA